MPHSSWQRNLEEIDYIWKWTLHHFEIGPLTKFLRNEAVSVWCWCKKNKKIGWAGNLWYDNILEERIEKLVIIQNYSKAYNTNSTLHSISKSCHSTVIHEGYEFLGLSLSVVSAIRMLKLYNPALQLVQADTYDGSPIVF